MGDEAYRGAGMSRDTQRSEQRLSFVETTTEKQTRTCRVALSAFTS